MPRYIKSRCRAKGCDKPRARAGKTRAKKPYCAMHTKRLQRTGSLDHPLDCMVDGCWKRRAPAGKNKRGKLYYRPFCYMHVNRVRRWGCLNKEDRNKTTDGRVIYQGEIGPTKDETLCSVCQTRERVRYKSGPKEGQFAFQHCSVCRAALDRERNRKLIEQRTLRTVHRDDGKCVAINETRRARHPFCQRTARVGHRTCHVHAAWEDAVEVASLIPHREPPVESQADDKNDRPVPDADDAGSLRALLSDLSSRA